MEESGQIKRRRGVMERLGGRLAAMLASVASAIRIAIARHGYAVEIGPGCSIGRGVRLRAVDGGHIRIGRDCHLKDGVHIIADGGSIRIGDHAFIGAYSLIAASAEVLIGADALIAEHVTIRDADHGTARDGRPYRQQKLITQPIIVGDNVWIGAGARLLRGATIANHSLIGANAVVTAGRSVPGIAGRYLGVPARFTPWDDGQPVAEARPG